MLENKEKKTPLQNMIELLENPILEYIWDGDKKDGRKKRGVLIAFVEYGKVLIGFSICHKTLDRFDYVDGKHKPGCGVEWAIARGKKWRDWKKCFVVEPSRKKAKKKEVSIPHLMVEEIEGFITKCLALKRYENREFPEWVDEFMSVNHIDVIDLTDDIHIETKVPEDTILTQLQP